jgi:hypothetical protein
MEKYNLFSNDSTRPNDDTKVSTNNNVNDPLTALNNIMVEMMEDDAVSAADIVVEEMEVLDKTDSKKSTNVTRRVEPPFSVDSDSDTDSVLVESLLLLASSASNGVVINTDNDIIPSTTAV